MSEPAVITDMPDDVASSRRQATFEAILIFLIFFIHGAAAAPEINETHYLSKAKHYWNPAWCANDFFCNSADAHQAFYWAFGWLTLLFSLPTVAWIGRLLIWAFLAYGWRRLSTAITARPFASVLSAGLFLTLMYRAHMAGEWVVGGVEAKGFAFGFGFLGIEAVLRGRWNRAWLWLGAAAALHVLVGGWLVVCAGFAWVVMWLGTGETPRDGRLWALVGGGLLALPGLIPAVMLTRGIDAVTVTEATRIYVFERLQHHLVAQSFSWHLVLRFLSMAIAWLLMLMIVRVPRPAERRLQALVNGALLICTLGLAISFASASLPDRGAGLLRYYWFRTADVMLPLGLSLTLTAMIVRQLKAHYGRALLMLIVCIGAVGWHLTTVMRDRAATRIAPGDSKAINAADWRGICEWVFTNTPEDAVFLTPRTAISFRWYANRSQVVSGKDIPQDAVGIVEWWRRMTDVYSRPAFGDAVAWRRSLAVAPPEELVRIGNQYGAQYLLTEATPPLPFELLSPPNASYAVYKLPAEWSPPPGYVRTPDTE